MEKGHAYAATWGRDVMLTEVTAEDDMAMDSDVDVVYSGE